MTVVPDTLCVNCAYYDPTPPSDYPVEIQSGHGLCRRFPVTYAGLWPVMEDLDWCGEFKLAGT